MELGKLEKTLSVKNMTSRCCAKLVSIALQQAGYEVAGIGPGQVTILISPGSFREEDVRVALQQYGFDIIQSREELICDQIKRAVFELVHDQNNVNSLIQRSEYLVEKMGMSYAYLSKTFSRHEHITLEKFILLHKIERVKELIDSNEFTLSEIAYMMEYSSVQYLSQQFRKITGMTVSEYKNSESKERVFIEDIIDKHREFGLEGQA